MLPLTTIFPSLPPQARRALQGFYGAVNLFLAALLLWWAGEIVNALTDRSLAGPEPVRQVWRWHRALTPTFERWARQRLGDTRAGQLGLDDISGTEWPLFGAVFYLRATENLDQAWQRAPQGVRPAIYARGAIDAAADLLADPAQSAWVQQHWGNDEYLRRENVFYRMLLIDALATQWRLTGRSTHADLLRDQVERLADELTRSPRGLLADYPNQTFPADVAAAWHAIRRADAVLGTDHSAAANAALRGFVGPMAPELGMPPYAWYGPGSSQPTDVRGSANAWLLHHAPFLWPAQARQWQAIHEQRFWDAGRWIAGYREFPRGSGEQWYADVDSGPVFAGIGTSASAFGVGAARSVGATNQAGPLALEMIAASWPLPNGRLLLPRILSDTSDAPLLGEAAIIYNLSQPAAPGFVATKASYSVPWIVYLLLIALVARGLLGVYQGIRRLRRALRPQLSV